MERATHPAPIERTTIFDRILDVRTACAHLADCKARLEAKPADYTLITDMQHAQRSLTAAVKLARGELRVIKGDKQQ